MIEWFLIAAAVIGAGALAFGARRRGQLKARVTPALTAAAQSLSGRLSAGSDVPELRAEIDGHTVTLKLAGQRLEVVTALPDRANTVRFYFGWDVEKAPAGLEHIPRVEFPGATLIAGRVEVRAEDPGLSNRFIESAGGTLLELWQAASGKSLEVTARGGYLTLNLVAGITDEALLSSAMRAAAELALLLDQLVKSPNLLPANARVSCAVCTDFKKEGEAWVRCQRCRAAHHLRCFHDATACGACHHDLSVPFEAGP